MTNTPVNSRNLVLEMLLSNAKGEKSHIVLKNTLDQHPDLEKQERAFITRLFEGTIERKIELDYIINQVSKIKTKKMKLVILSILRMSVYQLKYMDSVPEFAVCNEAVKLAKKRGFYNLKGFVNGVLRNVIKQMDTMEYPSEETMALSIQYSIPQWILELWIRDYGREQTKKCLESLYETKKTTVRIQKSKRNSGETEAAFYERIKEALKNDDVIVEETILPFVIRISGYDSLNRLKVFQQGLICVQDLSSVLVGVLANPQKNSQVIDVCAAPGGKSLCVADFMDGTGMVEARDLTEKKVSLIQENIKRCDIRNIKTKVFDATQPDYTMRETADLVIADLPCSGLGVIANKSDIKYNVSVQQIQELATLQREILQVVSEMVKPGGKLVFSTCTVNRLENDENAKWIQEKLGLCPVSIQEEIPKELLNGKTVTNQIQIFPGEFGMDGFFISVFEKPAKER
ncbi:MAG: 16S rRNA (cytosine(967)-C(5))-methyltransferase RsmB [Eubacterium sp.]|nr:16S rRNA (cytosine(967)-C(5))-methyltransferase RsmB [Eubacterium sp.]